MKIKRILRLSLELAKAEFKLRNEGSYLGIFWYLLSPLLMFGLLLFIFSSITGKDIAYYPLYLLLGLIMFDVFHNITLESTHIIKDKRYLIKSINFSYFALVFAIVLKFIFSHIFELLIFLIFLIILKGITLNIIFYPLILIAFGFFVYGASLFLAALGVYFFDLENVWLFLSRLLWFITPIFYKMSEGTLLFKLNLLNPVYYFITAARELMIYNKIPQLWIIFGLIGYTILFFIIGFTIFNTFKKHFTKMI